jgi:hypothetical protein
MAEHRRCRAALPVYIGAVFVVIAVHFAAFHCASGMLVSYSQQRYRLELTLPWSKNATNLTVMSDSQAQLLSVLTTAASYSPRGLDNAVMVAEVNDGFFPLAHNMYKQLQVRNASFHFSAPYTTSWTTP